MIALLATLLVALYVLGPDLVARWLLGFVVPRKNIVQTKSEEITRGALWAIVPFTLAWSLRQIGPLAVGSGLKLDLQTLYSGLYSEAFFGQHRTEFFSAVGSFYWLNVCLLVRLYTIVLIGSLAFNYLIGKYGVMRSTLSSHPTLAKLKPLLAVVILPRISEWHVVLSPILLPSKQMNIEVDVLTKSGTLYQGSLSDKIIAGDGSLHSLTLSAPKRFQRDRFLEKQREDPKIQTSGFWKPIPGNLFVIMGSDIATLNVRHIPSTVRRFAMEYPDVAKLLKDIESKVEEFRRKSAEERGKAQESIKRFGAIDDESFDEQ